MTDEKELLMDGEIEFHFEKSAFFRSIHVDGAFGGVSPANQQVHMAVYSERQPLPKKVVQKIAHGVLGAEIPERRVGRAGIFRELESDLIMSVEVAISLRDWLNLRIAEVQQTREQVAALLNAGTKQ